MAETDELLDTLVLPDSVIDASLEILWLTLTLLLTVADELIVPTCVAETDELLDTLVLPDSVIDASLEILWLTLTLRLTVADELTVPDSVSLTDELLEASVDIDIDVESEELTDAVGWLVTVKLDV